MPPPRTRPPRPTPKHVPPGRKSGVSMVASIRSWFRAEPPQTAVPAAASSPQATARRAEAEGGGVDGGVDRVLVQGGAAADGGARRRVDAERPQRADVDQQGLGGRQPRVAVAAAAADRAGAGLRRAAGA